MATHRLLASRPLSSSPLYSKPLYSKPLHSKPLGSRSLGLSLLIAGGLVPSPPATAQEATAAATDQGNTADPGEGLHAKLSDDARETLERCTVDERLRARLVASEPLLANPVAFCIDRLGRFFVVETYRVNRGVTDLRSHMDWLEEDLASKSVADRIALYRRHTPEEEFEETFATEEDRVVRLIDRDADGVLDERTVFADGFSAPESGVAAGILARTADDGGTEAWFTCIPDLVRFLDHDGDGHVDEQAVHSTGYGLRVALLGHDLHGLEIGPDARLYFTCGDRGFNVRTAEGTELRRYGTGAVFRCELDGTGLELFCDGLRNPQEILFDDDGNLLTLDNNSDAGDGARWTFLVEGSDSGWRQAYQWANDVSPRGPWIAERMCEPPSASIHGGQPAFILPPIANITDGPSGMCVYPGTGLGDAWRDAFFVCDFRGNAGYSGIWAVWNEPRGAGFALARTEKPVWDCLPTDVAFGPDGRLYWTDWISGWDGEGAGRILALEAKSLKEAEARQAAETARFLRRPVRSFAALELRQALRAPDRRVRMRAQLEFSERLLRAETRSETLGLLLLELDPGGATGGAAATGQRHAAWCAAQAARLVPADDPGRALLLEALAGAFEDAREVRDRGTLLPAHVDVLLARNDAQELSEACTRFAAGVTGNLDASAGTNLDAHTLALVRQRIEAWGRIAGRLGAADAAPIARALVDPRVTQDPWLRTTAVRALERSGGADAVPFLLRSEEAGARLAGVVLARRLRLAAVAGALTDAQQSVRAEAARAIYDVPIEAGLPALAERLVAADESDEWTLRRAIHAARAVASPTSGAQLVAFAADADRPAALRAEAVRVLSRWHLPETRDGIVRDHRPLPAADAEVLELAGLVNGDFGASVVGAGDAALAEAALDLFAVHGAGTELPIALSRAAALTDSVRALALERAIERFPSDGALRARIAELLEDEAGGNDGLRAVALSTLPEAEAAEHLVALASSESLQRRASAVRALGRLSGAAGPDALARVGEALELDDPALIEWLEAAEGSDSERVRFALSEVRARLRALDAGDIDAWRMCLEGGDAAAGERVFTGHAATSCTRCHAWQGEGGSEAGPALAGVGSRLSPEAILRSIVHPNAEIAEGFEAWLLALEDGEVISGRIVEETDTVVAVEMKDPGSGELGVFEFDPGEIATRRRDVSAMPADLIENLSRRQVRDLVAFLSSLDGDKAKSEPEGH